MLMELATLGHSRTEYLFSLIIINLLLINSFLMEKLLIILIILVILLLLLLTFIQTKIIALLMIEYD